MTELCLCNSPPRVEHGRLPPVARERVLTTRNRGDRRPRRLHAPPQVREAALRRALVRLPRIVGKAARDVEEGEAPGRGRLLLDTVECARLGPRPRVAAEAGGRVPRADARGDRRADRTWTRRLGKARRFGSAGRLEDPEAPDLEAELRAEPPDPPGPGTIRATGALQGPTGGPVRAGPRGSRTSSGSPAGARCGRRSRTGSRSKWFRRRSARSSMSSARSERAGLAASGSSEARAWVPIMPRGRARLPSPSEPPTA